MAEAITDGDEAVVENDFDGRRRALAHFVFVTSDLKAGESGRDEEGGDSLAGKFGLGFGKDDVDAGGGTVGDPGFGAGEFVIVAIADGSRLDAGCVGAGGRFGEAEGTKDFSGGEALEVAGFLFVGAEGEEGELHGGVGDGDGRRHGGVDARDFFEHEDVGDGVQTGAAPFFRHEHAATAESAEFTDSIEGKVVGAFPIFDLGTDFGVHELADRVADQKLLIVEGKVHRRKEC